MFGRGGKGGGGRKIKVTNIVESIDVGAPVSLTYNQWTQWSDFPKFMKKVENVDQPKEEQAKTSWKAQVFWSHRVWEATIREQVPDDKIIWRSKGAKGYVDGAVTFHELAPSLTRILMVLEYHPQGLFERTGNIWRAQGRRARLELKHYRRHLMTEVLLNPDDIEGWRGTIHDGEVVESHEDAIAREEKERSQQTGSRQSGDGQTDETAESTDETAESGAEESSEAVASEGADRDEHDEEAAPVDQEEREEDEEDEEDEGTGEESVNGRAARDGVDRPGRGRRPTRTRLADAERPESAGNGRQGQRAAAARRGDST